METVLWILFCVETTLAFDFLEVPVNTSVVEGGTAVLTCRIGTDAYGVGPTSSYWVRNSDNRLLSENTDTSKYARLHWTLARRLSILSDHRFEYSLQISDIQREDAGYYQCWHLDQNNYSHYAGKAYLNVLPRETETGHLICSTENEPSGIGTTIGSTVVFTCGARSDQRQSRDVGIYKSGSNRNSSVAMATCDHVPCSFSYTLELSDRNSRFVCGTRINNDVHEECAVAVLHDKQMINLESRPEIFTLHSEGTLSCTTAQFGSSYHYQWFLGGKNLTSISVDNEFTFPTVQGNLNNSEISCVVSDAQGYVGSKTILIYVAIAKPVKADASNKEDNTENVGVSIPVDESSNEQVAGNKMFGIPVEVLVFFLVAILILLLILIFVILLVYRQRTKEIGQMGTQGPQAQYGGSDVRIDLNRGGMSSTYRPLPPIDSQRFVCLSENSLYDNIDNDCNEETAADKCPYNSNNAKGTGVVSSPNKENLPTEYNTLDPYSASDDILDSFEIDELHERTGNKPGTKGMSLSVRTKPTYHEEPSARSRLASLPTGRTNTLYAVSNVIGEYPRDNTANTSECSESALKDAKTEADYASPCNRPKSVDVPFKTASNGQNFDVSNSAESDDITLVSSKNTLESKDMLPITFVTGRTQDNGVPNEDDNIIVLERVKDGVNRVLVLDDKKYIINRMKLSSEVIS